jgi:hypothetical protein
MKTYKARIRLNGRDMWVQVQARSMQDARAMIEAQYGKGSILNGPDEVR